jgi:hypothetical protein
MTLRGKSKGEFAFKPRGVTGLSPLRSDCSQDSETGRLSRMRVAKNNWQFKGGHQAQVHSAQMVHVMISQEDSTARMVAKPSYE